jgi:hypothetical protein
MLAGLYAAYVYDPAQWLAYSRRKEVYGPGRRYVSPSTSLRTVTAVVDYLAGAGLVDHRRGSYSRSEVGGFGYRSRIRTRPALAALLEGYGASPETLGFAPWTELVLLKGTPEYRGGPKALLPYTDTPETDGMRRDLRDLNVFLTGFRIDLEAPLDADEARRIGAERSSHLRRTFNNGRWDHGGRFYGGWWQLLRKASRAGLLIDGEQTVELDFRSFHPRLCYHLEGHPLPPEVDPYTVEGLEGPEQREAVKVAFNQLLNIAEGAKPKAKAKALGVLPRGLSYADLLARIEAAHPIIGTWFRSGRGVELQRIDSDIAADLLLHLREKGICCLPVHDSFIVPLSTQADLGRAMVEAYGRALKRRTPVTASPVISGWSD